MAGPAILLLITFLAVPFVDAATTGPYRIAGEMRFLGFDLAMIALGSLFLLAVRKAGQVSPRRVHRADLGLTGEEALRA